MKKEDIEKAASEYSGSILGFKDYPYVMKTHKAFADGAQWRINSVWHDAKTETPRNNEPIIGITGKICCYMGLCGETAKEICPEMKKWAYISDLLPERKEETK